MDTTTLGLLGLLVEWLSTSQVILDLIKKVQMGGEITQADMDAAREKVMAAVDKWDNKPV